MPDPEPSLSLPGAGCMLLFWGEPTDRALAGWYPFGYVAYPNEGTLSWLLNMVSQW